MRPQISPREVTNKVSPLIAAVERGDLATVRRLLVGVKVVANIKEIQTGYNRNLLHLAVAAKKNQKELLTLFIEEAIFEGGCASLINVRDQGQDTPLRIAVQKGHKDCIAVLIEKGAFASPDEGAALIRLAVFNTHAGADCIKLLINKGIPVNVEKVNEDLLLHLAVDHRDMPCLEILIDIGADVNAGRYREGTPLEAAIKKNWPEGILFLIDKGADVPRSKGAELLRLALLYKHINCIKLLINKGIPVSAEEVNRMFLLHSAVECKDIQFLKILIDIGANINARRDGDSTPLKVAIAKNWPEGILFLIDKGADVNHLSSAGGNALHLAVELNQLESCRVLSYEGEDKIPIQVRDDNRDTPLHIAVRKGHKDCIAVLIEKGAFPSPLEGAELLGIALWYKHIDCIKFLIDKGISVSAEEVNRMFLLHSAVEDKDMPFLEILIDIEADINARRDGGSTPLKVAIEKDWLEGMLFLIDKGADVNHLSSAGGNALHLAVELNYLESCRVLSYKLPLLTEATDENGYTPLHLAAHRGHIGCVASLEQSESIHRQENRVNVADILTSRYGTFSSPDEETCSSEESDCEDITCNEENEIITIVPKAS